MERFVCNMEGPLCNIDVASFFFNWHMFSRVLNCSCFLEGMVFEISGISIWFYLQAFMYMCLRLEMGQTYQCCM